MTAWTIGVVAYGWCNEPEAALREAFEAAGRAIHLDDKSAYAHFNLSVAHTSADSFDQGIRFAQTAIELSPSFALGHLALGMARLYSGQASEAIGPLVRGLQLNPFDPQNSHWFRVLALAHHFAGNLDQALEAALKAVNVRPSWPLTLKTLAVCYSALERWQEARDCVEQLRRIEALEGDPTSPLRRRNPGWAESMATLLRKAQLAEAAHQGDP